MEKYRHWGPSLLLGERETKTYEFKAKAFSQKKAPSVQMHCLVENQNLYQNSNFFL
jgi:hypothetical protein